jgi:hypothetical protein
VNLRGVQFSVRPTAELFLILIQLPPDVVQSNHWARFLKSEDLSQ